MKSINLRRGIIGEETAKTESYKVKDYPRFKAQLEKDVTYSIEGLTNQIKVSAKKGRYVKLEDEISTRDLTVMERIKLVLSLLNHIFDRPYWSKNVTKLDAIENDDEEVMDLKSQVKHYNDLVEQYQKIDGQKLKTEKTREILATRENLEEMLGKIKKEININNVYSYFS